MAVPRARSRCARPSTRSTSARSPASRAAAATAQAAGFSSDLSVEEITDSSCARLLPRSGRARSGGVPPRALNPSGIILVDKPAGPTSFAIVAATRRRTRARTGHAGTLDPFATGSCCSSPVRRRAPARLRRPDKRYLTASTSRRARDGRPRGRARGGARSSGPESSGRARRPPRRCRAAHSGGVRGEDRRPARLRLHRRGRSRDAARPMRVRELVLAATRTASLGSSSTSRSGTYVRAIADALGGHCVALRRTEIGPFSVDEADPERISRPRRSCEARVRIAHAARRELERACPCGRDRQLRRRPPRAPAVLDAARRDRARRPRSPSIPIRESHSATASSC